jgi:hypothetical protein
MLFVHFPSTGNSSLVLDEPCSPKPNQIHVVEGYRGILSGPLHLRVCDSLYPLDSRVQHILLWGVHPFFYRKVASLRSLSKKVGAT